MKKVFSLFIVGLILSGCTSENENIASKILVEEANYSFTGNSKSWEVLFEVNVIDKGQGAYEVDEKGTAEFIGDDEAPEIIDYKLTTESGSNSSK